MTDGEKTEFERVWLRDQCVALVRAIDPTAPSTTFPHCGRVIVHDVRTEDQEGWYIAFVQVLANRWRGLVGTGSSELNALADLRVLLVVIAAAQSCYPSGYESALVRLVAEDCRIAGLSWLADELLAEPTVSKAREMSERLFRHGLKMSEGAYGSQD